MSPVRFIIFVLCYIYFCICIRKYLATTQLTRGCSQHSQSSTFPGKFISEPLLKEPKSNDESILNLHKQTLPCNCRGAPTFSRICLCVLITCLSRAYHAYVAGSTNRGVFNFNQLMLKLAASNKDADENILLSLFQ